MAIDVWLQALPDEVPLPVVLRDDPEAAESLSFISQWLVHDRAAPDKLAALPGGGTDVVWEWCCMLGGRYPGIHEWSCSLGRDWDHLHYLLSATRREQPPAPDDSHLEYLFNKAPMVARSTCGFPVRLIDSIKTKELHAWLEVLSVADLATHYDSTHIEKVAVYKHNPDASPVETLRYLEEVFERFRAFVRGAAARGNQILMRKD